MDQKIKEILESFGWEQIISKNPYMESFEKEDMRLNYYFTKGTTTIQSEGLGMIVNQKDITTPEQMEKIICKIN